nr:hypothetical protein Iba_chr13aCG3060 [Ipomoea batatas]
MGRCLSLASETAECMKDTFNYGFNVIVDGGEKMVLISRPLPALQTNPVPCRPPTDNQIAGELVVLHHPAHVGSYFVSQLQTATIDDESASQSSTDIEMDNCSRNNFEVHRRRNPEPGLSRGRVSTVDSEGGVLLEILEIYRPSALEMFPGFQTESATGRVNTGTYCREYATATKSRNGKNRISWRN